jgi:hypothetical protein
MARRRVERRKLTSAEILLRDLDRNGYTFVPRDDCIRFDTEAMQPDAVAHDIVNRFGLTAN